MTGSRQVSVVIPSKDGRSTIYRALDSLVPSARHVREAFVVFSNSPAAYVEECQSLKARYAPHFEVRLLDSGPRSNGSIARNAPVPFVNGAYVAFLDDDDEWFEGKLDAYLGYIERRGLAGDFVLFSTVIGCQEDRSQPHLLPSRPYRGEPIAEFILSYGGGAQTSSLLLPASLARAVQFDPQLPRHQDYDYCIRLAEHGAAFHHLAQPWSYWYQRGNAAAKGGTFEFYTRWLLDNRDRLSARAFNAYVGKELFAAARVSGEWRSFLKFLRAHMTLAQSAQVLGSLNARAVRALARRFART